MRILLVEDDYLQSESLAQWLSTQIQGLSAKDVEIWETESEFFAKFQTIASAGYSALILDVMMRWADPAPNAPSPPAEVTEKGHHFAGLRCLRELLADPATRAIPVILYSVYTEDYLRSQMPNLPSTVSVVMKEANGQGLLVPLRRILEN